MPIGLLTDRCTLIGGVAEIGTMRVRVELDIDSHRFLRDHLVASRPLLSTVMQIETIASALSAARPGVSIAECRDIVVGPPVFLDETGRGFVDVSITGDACVLSSAEQPVHFSAFIGAGPEQHEPAHRLTPPAQPDDPRVDANAVYGLYFHGQSFQVIRSARYSDGLMVSDIASQLPPIVAPPARSLMAPLLIELCLQTAGLWELAALGKMMIPDGIDRVTRYTDADSGADTDRDTGADTDSGRDFTALVTPRRLPDGRYVFDAQVVDATGEVQLEVQGYRTTEFAHPIDHTAAAVIRQQLAGIPRLV